MFKPADLFDLSQTAHAALFDGVEFAWEVLKRIPGYVEANVRSELKNKCEGRAFIGPKVCIGEGTVVEDGVMIQGPAIIGRNCQIRHNAYIREHVIIGDNCVVGNSTELKNALLFNNAVAPHFNYVGDSILGDKAHIGAGVKISNVKLMPENVTVEKDGVPFDTGLRKFGAIMGDHTEVGCNAVLNPGAVLGRRALVTPAIAFSGYLPPATIAHARPVMKFIPRQD